MISESNLLCRANDDDGVQEDAKEEVSSNSVSVPLLRVYARQLTKSIGGGEKLQPPLLMLLVDCSLLIDNL